MGYRDSKINFPCPECKQMFQVSLQQLFPEEVLVCPICGATSPGGEVSEINQAFKKVEIELLNIHNILNNDDYSWES